ncbi:MAG TPA: FtsQ-type POTRA domain-containing protein, partial [Burkholderiaceae bacterium]|nr:FtsQ-type POTRA domain-containing protein [Burkholderiaceae bacterium]
MARAVAVTPLPFDVRLALAGANVLLTLLGVVIVAGAMWWLATRPTFTLRGITLEGDLAHSTPLTVRAAVNSKLAGNFLSLDLDRARDAFESVPWVRRATVRRVFPDRLAVRLEEHRAAALWNDDASEERLVNTFGEVFEANVGDVEDEALPRLAGPPGSSARVLAMHRALEPVLQPLGSPMRGLKLTGHGTWRTQLVNGVLCARSPSSVMPRSVNVGRVASHHIAPARITMPSSVSSTLAPTSARRTSNGSGVIAAARAIVVRLRPSAPARPVARR